MKSWLQTVVIVFAFVRATVGDEISDPARIEVYVTPYYNSKGPVIDVGPLSQGLATNSEPEFAATISKMKQSWNDLRFPEMYVAAIRLYDLGFRNESIYWFYSAQYRGRLVALERTGGMGAPGFELVQAANAFQQLVGPYINGYAFGNVDQLIRIVERVQKENKSVADLAKLYPGVTFQPRSEWGTGNNSINEGLTKFLTMVKDQKATIGKKRNENGTEAKFSRLASKELPTDPSR